MLLVRLHCRRVVEEDLPLWMYLECISTETWGESWGVLVLGGALPTRRKIVDKRGPRPPPRLRNLVPFVLYGYKNLCKAQIYQM